MVTVGMPAPVNITSYVSQRRQESPAVVRDINELASPSKGGPQLLAAIVDFGLKKIGPLRFQFEDIPGPMTS